MGIWCSTKFLFFTCRWTSRDICTIYDIFSYLVTHRIASKQNILQYKYIFKSKNTIKKLYWKIKWFQFFILFLISFFVIQVYFERYFVFGLRFCKKYGVQFGKLFLWLENTASNELTIFCRKTTVVQLIEITISLVIGCNC